MVIVMLLYLLRILIPIIRYRTETDPFIRPTKRYNCWFLSIVGWTTSIKRMKQTETLLKAYTPSFFFPFLYSLRDHRAEFMLFTSCLWARHQYKMTIHEDRQVNKSYEISFRLAARLNGVTIDWLSSLACQNHADKENTLTSGKRLSMQGQEKSGEWRVEGQEYLYLFVLHHVIISVFTNARLSANKKRFVQFFQFWLKIVFG